MTLLDETTNCYHAFMVRLWQDSSASPWRASVQNVQTGETVRFSETVQLFRFLQAQMLDVGDKAGDKDDAHPIIADSE